MTSIYKKLAKHLEGLTIGYPFSDVLLDMLKEMYHPNEAEVILSIPNDLNPFEVVDADVIISRSSLPPEAVLGVLEDLAARHLIYTAPTANRNKGYALLQVGYGMPQTFFWGGEKSDSAKKMAKMVVKYFSTPVTTKVYGGTPTKVYKYSPVGLSVDISTQGVLPHEQIGNIVESADKIAVAHCPCRMSAKILGRTDCVHSLEVCIKYDDMAEFVLNHGLAREVSKDEALHILKNCEEEGLVHMIDNAQGQVKHTCNCCGHYCWNVGNIKRRKIPRDILMAVYFIRETEKDACVGCGACEEICPVDVVCIENGFAVVDNDWCIGCGVCAVACPTEAISIKRRIDASSPETLPMLHQQIQKERL